MATDTRTDPVRLATPLRTAGDLDPLLDRIGEARVVCLGEASHGTHEYYAWRALLTQRLIEERGFDLVGVEGDWPDCYAVSCSGTGAPGAPVDPRQVLEAFERWPTWMWANEEVDEFTRWLRRHNLDRPEQERVGFYRLDVYSLWGSLREVVRYLQTHHPEHLESALEACRCLEPYAEDPQAYARATAVVPASCELEVVTMLSELLQRHGSEVPPGPGGRDAAFAAEQNARAAVGAEACYREMVHGGPQPWKRPGQAHGRHHGPARGPPGQRRRGGALGQLRAHRARSSLRRLPVVGRHERRAPVARRGRAGRGAADVALRRVTQRAGRQPAAADGVDRRPRHGKAGTMPTSLNLSRVGTLRVRVAYRTRRDLPAHDAFLLEITLPPGEGRFDELPYLSILESVIDPPGVPPDARAVRVSREHRSWAQPGEAEICVDLSSRSQSAVPALALDAVKTAFRRIVDHAAARPDRELSHEEVLREARLRVERSHPDAPAERLTVTDEEHLAHESLWSVGLALPDRARFVVSLGFVDGLPAATHIRRVGVAEIVDSVGTE